MRVGIDYGLERLEVEVAERDLVRARQQTAASPLSDPSAAVREALEKPVGFPALRRALTPDDHVVILIDEQLSGLVKLLIPVLEHVTGAGVSPEMITLLCAPSSSRQEWVNDLPEEYESVQVEVHDPANRKRLSYLAATKQGRRIYLNRTAVDADQIVVLSRRTYDPLLGYGGSEGALFPALSDEETRQGMWTGLSQDVRGQTTAARKEAQEVAWLLGAPFMIQVIEGLGDEVLHVLCGLADSSAEGDRLLDASWRSAIDEPVETVVAGISGNPAHHGYAEIVRALSCAAKVVKPKGRMIILSRAKSAEQVSPGPKPVGGLDLLIQGAGAVAKATVFLLSDFPAALAKDLRTTPLENPSQVQKLLSGSCLFIPDAHKSLVVVEKSI